MALINCPDCAASVSSEAMKCQGCGCALRIRVRGFWGKLFKWTFIGWNVFMLIWLIGGFVAAASTPVHSEAEEAGRALGTALGVGFLMWIWFGGAFWFGVLVLLSRPNSSSPSIAVPRLQARPLPRAAARPAKPVAEAAAPLPYVQAPNVPGRTQKVVPSKKPARGRAVVVLAGLGGVLAGAGVVVAVIQARPHEQPPAPPAAIASVSVQPVSAAPPAPAPTPPRKAHAKQLHRPSTGASTPTLATTTDVVATAPAAPVAPTEATTSRGALIDPYADDPKPAQPTLSASEAASAARSPVTVAARVTEPLPPPCKEYQDGIDQLANGCRDQRAKSSVNQLRDEFHRQYANWDAQDADQKAQLAKTCPMLLVQLHSDQIAQLKTRCEAE